VKLNRIQKRFANSGLRAWVQARFEVPRLLRCGGGLEAGTVLEVGCGCGEGVRLILSRFGAAHVTGVDIDPEQVETAQGRLKGLDDRVTLTCGDAQQLEYPDGAFDAVFDFQMLHHAEDWRAVVREVSRVLRPGGRFYLSELCNVVLGNRLVRAVFEPNQATTFDADALLAGCEQVGLSVRSGGVSRLGNAWVFACAVKPMSSPR